MPRESNDTAVYLDRLRGAEAYRHVNTVVILDENMRHRGDPQWKNILQRWRHGIYVQADIDLVNRICYEQNWGSDGVTTETFCPVIVTSNVIRSELNASALRQFCVKTGRPLHRFQAKISRSRFALNQILQQALQGIRDDKTGGMPVILELAVGITVQCTKNTSEVLKLTNGTIGYVVDFVTDEQDSFREVTANCFTIHYHSHPPVAVYVKHIGYAGTSFLPHLPVGVVPVRQRVEKSINVRMPARSFNVTIKQVPLVPAFALTSEKCQGLTVDKMILGPMRHPTRRAPQRSSFYVAVTRVRILAQLYLMEPLTKQFLAYFTPRADALAENARLEGFTTA